MKGTCKSGVLLSAAVFLCSCGQAQEPIDIDLHEETTTTAAAAATTTTTITTQQETAVSFTGEPVPNNWYTEGFVVPDNWVAVMTDKEAFEHYDRLTGEIQEDKTVEEIVENLVNRNILVFEIFHGSGYESETITDLAVSYTGIHRITSAPFDSAEDLVELVNGTYTSDVAANYRSDDGDPRAFFEQDGELYVDINKIYVWNTNPFSFQTYLEFISADDSDCTFIWHYVTWEYYDYEYNNTDELYPHHYGMTFHAVRENDVWRLISPIFDNPALDQG